MYSCRHGGSRGRYISDALWRARDGGDVVETQLLHSRQLTLVETNRGASRNSVETLKGLVQLSFFAIVARIGSCRKLRRGSWRKTGPERDLGQAGKLSWLLEMGPLVGACSLPGLARESPGDFTHVIACFIALAMCF